jgi:predicted nucleic acid-binding protein
VILLDINIVSEWVKPKPSAELARWLDAQAEDELFISVITFAELRRGASLLQFGKKRDTLRRWIDGSLTDRFEGRTLAVDRTVCDLWGDLLALSRQKGITLSVMDGFIAATAMAHQLALATRNTKDFSGLELSLVDPFHS